MSESRAEEVKHAGLAGKGIQREIREPGKQFDIGVSSFACFRVATFQVCGLCAVDHVADEPCGGRCTAVPGSPLCTGHPWPCRFPATQHT